MFLGYYKAVNKPENDADVICVIGRSSLTNSDNSVNFNNQLLTTSVEGNYIDEGARILQLCQEQNLISISSTIDPDIEIMSRTLIKQLKDYKISNPLNKASMLMSVKRYTPDFMYYLDWEDRYVSIMDTDPTLVGKTYIRYTITEGPIKRIQVGSFEIVT